jgi:hypothetical protein
MSSKLIVYLCVFFTLLIFAVDFLFAFTALTKKEQRLKKTLKEIDFD